MPDDQFDDDEHEEQQGDTDLVRTLRNQLREKSKRAKQADELEAKVTSYERREALKEVGLTDLSPRKMKALEASHEGEWSPEGVRETAVELGFLTVEQPDETDEALEAHDRIGRATVGAGRPAAHGVITSDVYMAWPMHKRRDFQHQYPEHFKALERGDEVVGLTF